MMKMAFKPVLIEALVVGAISLLLAYLANMVSPAGVTLGGKYFPDAAAPDPHMQALIAVRSAGATNATERLMRAVTNRLAQKGLHWIQIDEFAENYAENRARQATGQLVIVDTRSQSRFAAGHIPGALLFDHYRFERYLDPVLPACMNAECIVIYCDGGGCEDSEFGAQILRELGVPTEKMLILLEGFEQWHARGLPIEQTGQTNGQQPKQDK